jgi:hypothetical protein
MIAAADSAELVMSTEVAFRPENHSTGDTIPPGIHESRAAFNRALPELLKDRTLFGKWIAFNGTERIGIADDDDPLIRACINRGLKSDEYIVDVIEPKPAEPEEVDFPSSWR